MCFFLRCRRRRYQIAIVMRAINSKMPRVAPIPTPTFALVASPFVVAFDTENDGPDAVDLATSVVLCSLNVERIRVIGDEILVVVITTEEIEDGVTGILVEDTLARVIEPDKFGSYYLCSTACGRETGHCRAPYWHGFSSTFT